MANYEPKATVRRDAGVAIIDLHGEIDAGAETVLRDAYARAERGSSGAILINFDHVSYIGSKGIAVIAVLLRKAIGSHRRLYACGLSEHFREIFRITRLSDYITLCTDEKRALEDIRMYEGVPSLLPE